MPSLMTLIFEVGDAFKTMEFDQGLKIRGHLGKALQKES